MRNKTIRKIGVLILFGSLSTIETSFAAMEDNARKSDFVFDTQNVVKVEIELDQKDWKAILADPTAEEYKSAKMTFNGEVIENVGVRTKGNSSLQSTAANRNTIRYSFKVDMNKYVDKQKFKGLKKLNFNNGYSDPSMMREVLSYGLMDEMGLPAPRIAYVDLWIGGEHMGLYNVVEQIDSEFIEDHFENDEGDLYKAEMGANLQYKGANPNSYVEKYDLKANKKTSDRSALVNFIDMINNGDDPAQVIDVDQFMKYLAVSTIMGNLDSYQGPLAHNYYLYEEQGKFTLLPWDFNMSFGGFGGSCSKDEILGLLNDEPTTGSMATRPLINSILQDANNRAIYHGYLEQLVNEVFVFDQLSAEIDGISKLIDPYVKADPTKFFTYDDWKTSLVSNVASSSRIAPTYFGLKTFIQARIDSVRMQLNGEIPSENAGKEAGSGSCSSSFGFPGGGFPRRGDDSSEDPVIEDPIVEDPAEDDVVENDASGNSGWASKWAEARREQRAQEREARRQERREARLSNE